MSRDLGSTFSNSSVPGPVFSHVAEAHTAIVLVSSFSDPRREVLSIARVQTPATYGAEILHPTPWDLALTSTYADISKNSENLFL